MAIVMSIATGSFATGAAAQDCAVGGNNRPANSTQHCVPSDEPASHPNADPGSGTGLSIDLISGNKYLAQTDAVWPGGLTMRRHYNSLNRFTQSMGPSWRHGFDTVLSMTRVRPGGPGQVEAWQAQIIQADGRRILFTQRRGTGHSKDMELAALNPLYGAIRVQPEVAPDRRYQWQWRDGSRLHFSTTGHLTATDMADGRRLSFRYESFEAAGAKPRDPEKRLVQVKNRFGQSMAFEYTRDADSTRPARLAAVTLPDGGRLSYGYNGQGVLNGVLRRGVPRWRFVYADDRQSALTTVLTGSGVVIGRYRYNAQGRASYSSATGSADDPLAIRVEYQLPGSVQGLGESIVTDAKGQITRYRWRYEPRSQRRQLLSATGPGCRVCPASNLTRRYDKQGRPVELVDSSGRVTRRWHYDTIGRLRRIDTRRGGNAHSGAMSSQWFHYLDDSFASRVARLERSSVAPGKRHQVLLYYNPLGQLTRLVESGYAPDVGGLSDRAVRKDTASINPRVRRWLPIRRELRYRYVTRGPAEGLPSLVDGPLAGSKDTSRFVYDGRGRLLRRYKPGGRSLSYTYDANLRLASITNQAGRTWEIDSTRPETTRVSSRGVSVTRHWNAAGRLASQQYSYRPAQQFEWSADGRLHRIRNDQGQWLTRDALHLGAGALPTPNVELAREPLQPTGRKRMRTTGLTQALKSTVQHWRDDFGRYVATVDPEVGVIRRAFDSSGRVVARSFHGGGAGERWSTRLYQYNEAGDLTGIRDQDGPLLVNRFRPGGLASQRQRHQEVTLSQEPNSRDHQWQLRYFDPVSGAGFDEPLSFTRKYDRRGRLVQRGLPGGWAVIYRWTAGNRLSAMDLASPDGQTSKLASELSWLPFAGGRRGLLSARFGNGSERRILRDNKLRTTAVRSGQGLPALHLAYDNAGRVTQQIVGKAMTRYQYNPAGHLISWRQNDQPAQRLHRGENRAQKMQLPATTGGRTRWSRDSSGRTYRYIYNLSGQRIGKLAIGNPVKSRWFVYDAQRLFMETDGSGRPLVIYLYLDDKPFVMLRATEQGRLKPFWIHTDHRGTPLLVTDHQREIVWRGEFSPYGRLLRATLLHDRVGRQHGARMQSGSMAEGFMPLRLPGQYHDADTDLHDNYHRTYNPDTGRYLGPDPIGPRPGAYRYAYARFSPMDTTDPLGLYEIDVHYYMTYFLARMAGMGHEDANVVAHATQGIDDNPNTRPTDPGFVFGQDPVTPFVNQERLRTYHFVMYNIASFDGEDDGITLPIVSRETADPQSWQLTNLRRSVTSAASGCARMQLLGEMLHAYEDTYAHRNYFNIPFSATNDYGLGTGHMIVGHSPDYTYNPNLMWRVNEDRTWQMEQDVYQRLLEYGNSENAIPPDQFEAVVREFNSIRENHQTGFTQKLSLLDRFMRENGIMVDTVFGPEQAQFLGNNAVVYSAERAVQSRGQHLCGQRYNGRGTIAPNC